MHNSNGDDIGRLSWAGYIFCERWRGLLTELANDTAPPEAKHNELEGTEFAPIAEDLDILESLARSGNTLIQS